MKTKILLITIFLVQLFFSQNPGQLDTNFGNNGQVTTLSATEYYPWSIDLQYYSGNIYTAGQANFNGSTYAVVSRYDFYGNLDTSFANSGYSMYILPGNSYQTANIVVANAGFDGYFIMGTFKDSSNILKYSITKFDHSGNLITSFGTNGTMVSNSVIRGNTNGIFSMTGIKYNANGIDNTFNFTSNQINPYSFSTCQTSSDGSVFFGGSITISSVKYEYMEKHKPDGSLDTNFANGGKYVGVQNNDGISDIQFQKNGTNSGKIVYLRKQTNSFVNTSEPYITRLNSNGTLDTTFGQNGSYFISFGKIGNWLNRILVKNGDEIIVCGSIVNSTTTSQTSLIGISNNGTFQYITANNTSDSSENWSMCTIPNSFVLTFGNTYNSTTNLYTNKIQRYYLETPIIALIGDAYQNGNWTNELVMNTTDNTTYTLKNIYLQATNDPLANGVKFRLDGDWRINWGAAANNPFPSGNATMGRANIAIPNADYYDISFNIKTGFYSFTKHLATSDGAKKQLSIYPNPAKNVLNFSEEINTGTIYSLSGRKIKGNISGKSADVSQLTKGVYLLNAVDKLGNNISLKFIKE